MRLKKGFTLAEILIVLMVIGVIATMTIPSMMKGVTEAQLKAGYKKAYNTISNFAAMERVAGTLPNRGSHGNVNAMYTALNTALSVKAYGQDGANSGTIVTAASNTCLTLTGAVNAGTLGTQRAGGTCATVNLQGDTATPAATANVAWIITEDNIAYAVVQGGRRGDDNADTKQQIAATANNTDAMNASSLVIYADVNGLGKGPNTFETQGLANPLNVINPMDTITGDRYKIYIGSDGATAGPREATVTGRIAADLK